MQVARKSEDFLEKEKNDVQIKLMEISETNKNLSSEMQELSRRVSELERDLDQANMVRYNVKAEFHDTDLNVCSQLLKEKESEIEELQQRLHTTSEPQPCGGG